MSQAASKARVRRGLYLAIPLTGAVVAGGLLLLGRQDIQTRQVRYNGQLCTEYFDAKDGIEVRAECPSRGGERYVDTLRLIEYAPGFPIKYATKPANDR